jgi:hypothetical protein
MVLEPVQLVVERRQPSDQDFLSVAWDFGGNQRAKPREPTHEQGVLDQPAIKGIGRQGAVAHRIQERRGGAAAPEGPGAPGQAMIVELAQCFSPF